MSNKIQSDEQNKNVFRFHLFKLGVHLLLLFFSFYFSFFFLQCRYKYIDHRKKKSKQGIKLGKYKQDNTQPSLPKKKDEEKELKKTNYNVCL